MTIRACFAALAAFLLTACATLGGGVAQSDRDFKNEDEFRAWFAYYYKAPHPEDLTAALHFMGKSGYLDEEAKQGLDTPVIASVFLARIFAANQSDLPRWADTWKPLGQKEWYVLLIALWMTDTDQSRQLLSANMGKVDAEHQERLKGMLARSPATIDPLLAEVVDPRQIALLWAAFSATGDERYIKRVITYVRYFGEEPEEKSDIGEMALNTLAINSLQHEPVSRLCNEALVGDPDPKTRVLMKAMVNAIAQLQQEEAEKSQQAAPAH